MTPKVQLFIAFTAYALYSFYCATRHTAHHAWEHPAPTPAQTVVSMPEPTFSIRHDARGPVLVGDLPGEAMISPILSHANALYGVGGFEDRLHVRTVARAPWITSVPALIDAFRLIPRAGALWVHGQDLVVSGEVGSEEERARVLDRVRLAVGAGVEVHAQLAVARGDTTTARGTGDASVNVTVDRQEVR